MEPVLLLPCTKDISVLLKLLSDHSFCVKPDNDVGHLSLQVADGNGAEYGGTESCDVPDMRAVAAWEWNVSLGQSSTLMYTVCFDVYLVCFDVYLLCFDIFVVSLMYI